MPSKRISPEWLLSPLAAYAISVGDCQARFARVSRAQGRFRETALDSGGGRRYAQGLLGRPLAAVLFGLGGVFMRHLLALCGAAVLAFVGVGWYLDWFR